MSFDAFWSQYPRRVAKGDARKAWEKALKREPELLPKCLTALEWQRRQEQWTRDNGQYIPYPATWLNGERWADEPVVITVQTVSAEDEASYRAMRQRASDELEARQREWEQAAAKRRA